MSGEAAELAFVATMRDEASAVARQARKAMDGVGGATKPITTKLDVDASGAKGAADEAKRALEGIEPAARKVGDDAGAGLVDRLTGGISGAKGKIVGAFTALGLGAALSETLDADAATDKLAASLGATPKQAQRYGKLAGDLYAGAWGGSLEEVSAAVGAVKTSFDDLGNGAGLRNASIQALDFATIFDTEVSRAAQAAGLAVKSGLAKNATEAFDLLTAASQRVPVELREDVIDASNEYGQFFASLGYDGEAAFSVLAAGAQKGMFGIDKAGDAVKEFTIRATDMSESSKGAYKTIGLDAKTMANQILAGGDTAQKATGKVIDGLLGIKNPAKQANTAIALFGTPLEDLNVKDIPAFLKSLQGAGGELGKVQGASARAGAALNDNARTNLVSFGRQAKMYLVNMIGGEVLPALSDVAASLATNFGPAVTKAGDLIKSTTGFFQEHETVARTLAIVIGVLAVATGAHAAVLAVGAAGGMAAWLRGTRLISAATKVWAAVQWVMNAALAANPIGLTVIAIIALVAALVLAWRKSDQFRAVVLATWGAIKAGVSAAVGAVKGAIGGAWSWIKSTTAKTWGAIKGATSATWNAIRSAVGKAVAGVQSVIRSVFAAISKVISTYVAVWRAVITTAWKVISAVVRGAIAVVRSIVVGGFSAIRGAISSAMNAARSVVSNAWGAIKGAVSKGVSNVVDLARGMIGRTKAALGGAGTALISVGQDLIRGFIGGIGDMADQVLGAVENVIGGAKAKAKALLGINSPSRVFRQIGAWTVQGFVKGLDGGRKSVDVTLGKLFGQVGAFYRKRIKNDKAAEGATKRVLGRLRDEANAIRKNAAAYDALVGKLKRARTYAADLTKATLEASKVTSIDETNGAPITAGFIVQGLRDKVAAIRAFRKDLATLRDRKLSREAIAQIEAQGYEEGAAYASALATGTDQQIRDVGQAQAKIRSEAEKLGTESVAGIVRGVQSDIAKVEKVGRRLALALRRAIRKALGINSPSRKLAEDGGHTAAGLAKGILDNVGQAEHAAAVMAARVSAAAVPTIPQLASMANASARLSPVMRSAETITIRHEVVSPDGSVSKMTAAQVADLIARDPKSASKLAAVFAVARRRRASNTISASS